jgi:NAD(P)-dependent dehydrogenase (short-subunit alcohol dehydrogenase family)
VKRLAGRIALVTGGASGIGFVTAQTFLREGARVVIAGRDEAKLALAAQQLGHADCLAVRADVAVEGDCVSLIEKIRVTWGALDIVVNNAGIVRRDRPLDEVESEDWDHHLAANLKSVFLVCKHAIRLMEANGGAIVNIGSQLAFVAAPNYPAYCAAKAGVVGLTRSIALDYAAHGIRANCVCPGLTETPMAYIQRENFNEQKADIVKLHPLGRLGRPEDMADAILFFASAESAWITGQTLVVDGGYTLR